VTDRPLVPAIFFLSDYGTADEFVGVVHAVLHRLAPQVPVIDLSHQIPAFDVPAGATMLVRSAPYLGPGAVLAVVDPGVGTARRAVAIHTPSEGSDPEGGGDGPTWLVGPDNGLLMPMTAACGGAGSAIDLGPSGPGHLSGGPAAGPGSGPTFDGRDVFAPAAAHLAQGGDPRALGPAIDPATLVPAPADAPGTGDRVERTPGGPVARVSVASIDRFGNAQLGLGADAFDELGLGPGGMVHLTVGLGGERPPVPVRRVRAFGELDLDELGLLVDSTGRLALVCDRRSAADLYHLEVGTRLVLSLADRAS
jgi:S-adenosyl-L-methionine hydrolase (adenosine-forming)